MLESKPRADRWFFGFAGLWFVALTLVGFSPTFHCHSNPVPLPFHLIIHGVLYSTWILVFLCQTQLIATRRTAWQRRFGAISVLLLILMIPVGFYVVLVKTAAGLKSIDDAGRNANSFRVFAAQLGIRQPQGVGHKFNRRNVARSRMAAAHQLSRRVFDRRISLHQGAVR